MVEEKGVYIYANLLDLNEDGKIDMISFLDPQGRGIAVAVDRASDGDMDHIHVFQDVTGDGKLDMDDTRLIEREALKLFRQEGLEEGIGLKIFRRMLVPPAGDQADVAPCRPGNPVLDGAAVTLVVDPFQTVGTFP